MIGGKWYPQNPDWKLCKQSTVLTNSLSRLSLEEKRMPPFPPHPQTPHDNLLDHSQGCAWCSFSLSSSRMCLLRPLVTIHQQLPASANAPGMDRSTFHAAGKSLYQVENTLPPQMPTGSNKNSVRGDHYFKHANVLPLIQQALSWETSEQNRSESLPLDLPFQRGR